MFEESVNRQLHASLADKLPSMLGGAGALSQLPDQLRKIGLSAPCLLVCDANSWEAAGKACMDKLDRSASVCVLPGMPQPDIATVETIRNAASSYGAIIAVGSGTISDLCKYASARAGKPYVMVATAPSMNGYSSANASIIFNGHKQSIAAHLPAVLVCDDTILANAPLRLIRAGFGDALARYTAQTDWLLSHLVLGSAYDERPFQLLAPYDCLLLAQAAGLSAREPAAIRILMRHLLLSGFGMTIAGGSYPASQAEHMVAHTMEMAHANTLPLTYHGEQIGLTTLTVATLQQQVMQNNNKTNISDDYINNIKYYFGTGMAAEIIGLYEKKLRIIQVNHSNPAAFKERVENALRALKPYLIDPAVIASALQTVGAPHTAAALGWNNAEYNAAVAHAKYSRERFTFLDLI